MLVDLDKISKDLRVVTEYRSDPLVYEGHATLKMAQIVASQFGELIENSSRLRILVLIQHGTHDLIADPHGSERLRDAYGSPDKLTFRLYPGLWHEIYNEPEDDRQRPLDDLREWLASHRR